MYVRLYLGLALGGGRRERGQDGLAFHLLLIKHERSGDGGEQNE